MSLQEKTTVGTLHLYARHASFRYYTSIDTCLERLRMDRVKICRDACLNVSRNDETLCSYTRCVSTHINTF